MTYMGDSEKFNNFDEEYSGLDSDMENVPPAIEEEDPFSALDDFATEGNPVVPAEKELAGEEELAVVVDEESADALADIETAVDEEGKSAKGLSPEAIKKLSEKNKKQKRSVLKPGKKVKVKSTAKKAKKKSIKKKKNK
jgi:hypothetical protein